MHSSKRVILQLCLGMFPSILSLLVLACGGLSVASGQQQQISVQAAQGINQLSGTVVDTSGAVLAGASVMVRSADGSCREIDTVRQQRLLQYFWTRGG